MSAAVKDCYRNKAGWNMCAIGRWGPRPAMPIHVGICTTLASRYPAAVGKAVLRPVPRCPTPPCKIICAAHATAVNSGAVDSNLLLLNNRPIAFAYNYHYRGWVYGLRSGFDSSVATDGAGNVLMAKMLEDSARRGDHLFDLGPNYLDCKRNWLTRLQPAYHFTHFHPGGVRAQALRLKRIVKRWLGATKKSGDGPDLDVDANEFNKRTLLKKPSESNAKVINAGQGNAG